MTIMWLLHLAITGLVSPVMKHDKWQWNCFLGSTYVFYRIMNVHACMFAFGAHACMLNSCTHILSGLLYLCDKREAICYCTFVLETYVGVQPLISDAKQISNDKKHFASIMLRPLIYCCPLFTYASSKSITMLHRFQQYGIRLIRWVSFKCSLIISILKLT